MPSSGRVLCGTAALETIAVEGREDLARLPSSLPRFVNVFFSGMAAVNSTHDSTALVVGPAPLKQQTSTSSLAHRMASTWTRCRTAGLRQRQWRCGWHWHGVAHYGFVTFNNAVQNDLCDMRSSASAAATLELCYRIEQGAQAGPPRIETARKTAAA